MKLKTMSKTALFGLVLLAAMFLAACRTAPSVFNDIDNSVHRGDFRAAIDMITEAQEDPRNPLFPIDNAISLFLDLGMLHHFAGDFQESSRRLLEAERLIDDAFTRSITEGFLTWIANDNAREYPGEDFEDIYISIFNALNFFHMGNLDAAMVEIRKLTLPNGKLNILARRHEDARAGFADSVMEVLDAVGLSLNDALPQGDPVRFYNSALARYLSILFYLASGNADSARIEYEQLHAAFASNPRVFNHPMPSSAGAAREVPTGLARLNVLGFTGLSPIKQEQAFFTYWGWIPFFTQRPFHTPRFLLPVLVDRPNTVDRIVVHVDGVASFPLELLENMGAVVKETFNARFANLFFRTYLRVLSRYIAGEFSARAAVEASGREWAGWAMALSVVATSNALEGADIRMGRFIPNKAHVGGINLEPGTYNVTIYFYNGNRRVGSERREGVVVGANQLNLIQVNHLN